MATYVLTGAHIKLYINNTLYKEVQGLSFSVDYGETEFYGIDSAYPQEIAPGRVMVRGSVNGLRLKYSGGIQGKNMRPLFNQVQASPYISVRVVDRQSGEDIMLIPQAKITKESHQIVTKSTYKLNFEFVGMLPLQALDRS